MFGSNDQKSIASDSSTSLAATEVQLKSSVGGKSSRARVMLCPGLSSNWISGDMVRRLEVEAIRRQSAKVAEWEGRRLVSTGHVLKFSCPGKDCSHRFHVVQKKPLAFDLLYGAEFVEEHD